VNGTIAGTAKTFTNLTFLEVYNAGHLVPMNQPQNALDMLVRFIYDSPFN